jgi:NitT/TauT family transport system substrate-binding protein
MKFNHQLKNRSSILITTLLLMMAALGLAGCGSSDQATTEGPLTQTSVQLGWVHTMEYAGFYMAEEKGYFADENLSVKLLEGGFDANGNFIDPIAQVTSGKAEFGVADGNALLRARANGVPVIAIATIYQRNPVAFISLAEKNIIKPQDLIGKKLAIDLESATGISYLALLASQSIDPSQVNQVPRTSFTNDQLTNGEVDVLDAFITNQPVQLELAGYSLNIILASDYGIEMYPNVIFTTEATIANKPDLVERLLQATVRGMQSAIDNPKEAAAQAVARNNKTTLESELASMNRSLPLLKPVGSQPGMMQAKAWETAHQILLNQGILKEPLEVADVYNLTFMEKIYNHQAANQ